MNATVTNIDRLIRDIRACFNRLAMASDRLHRERAITAAMRAVMESLAEAGPETVPRIARAKRVSRQHIQVNADALIAAGLAAIKPNPAHQRSALLVLTPKGKSMFAEMRRQEFALMEKISAGVSAEAVGRAAKTLDTLRANLDRWLAEPQETQS